MKTPLRIQESKAKLVQENKMDRKTFRKDICYRNASPQIDFNS